MSAANVYINQQANDLYVVNTNGATLNYWNGTQTGPQGDGQLHGGDGTWTAATGSFNWTNSPGYDLNGAWTNDGFAVFGGAKGLVTVDTSAGAISASGMQFITTGYKLSGGTLALVPTTGSPRQSRSSALAMAALETARSSRRSRRNSPARMAWKRPMAAR
ncbi:outer membrane autotransporter [Brucella sp. 10RB9215]|nr:outer membrane autotransporter [Brucella sp. 10RB9215]